MVKLPEITSKRICEDRGFYWYDNACHSHSKAVEEGLIGSWSELSTEEMKKILGSKDLMEHGKDLWGTWVGLAFEKPPDGFLDRLIWSVGVLGQLVISFFTFPAALGAFLLEEAVQTTGMGAYMLSTAKAWNDLDEYLPLFKSMIDAGETGAATLATVNPITGGAVIFYMQAAQLSYNAFRRMTDHKLVEAMVKEADLGKKMDWIAAHGELRLFSTPSNAEIWIDNESTEKLTPETFKDLDVGSYDITLRKFSVSREVWDIFSFTIEIEGGRRKEVHARIPPVITDEIETTGQTTESDQPRLPDFIKAEVTGEYAIDGDTFITTTGERIRVLGIDAPEIGRPWSEESREALTILVEDKKIQLRIQSHKPLDQYGRTLGICSSWKGDIAIFQLSSGLARVAYFEDDIFDYTKYYTAEQIAKDRKIGIWS